MRLRSFIPARLAKARPLLAASLTANLGLSVAAVFLFPRVPSQPEGSVPPALRRQCSPAVSAQASPATPTPPPRVPFHWSQIESSDYRVYIANLRAIGCPERLIRDLVVADLEALYASTRADPIPSLPPWAGRDRRDAAHRDAQLQRRTRELEQCAVVEELLGCPWSREASWWLRHQDEAAVTLGILPHEQAIQALALVGASSVRVQLIRLRADHILLPEDHRALAAVADELEARLRARLTSDQQLELSLRIHAQNTLESTFPFAATGFTGAELREVVRLSSLTADVLREELLGIHEAPPAEREQREEALLAAVARQMGPTQAADLQRAGDPEFRETLDFALRRQLPRRAAIRAHELREAAEVEAQRLLGDPQREGASRETGLEALQRTTLATLAGLFPGAVLKDYLEGPGRWLESLIPPEGDPEGPPAAE